MKKNINYLRCDKCGEYIKCESEKKFLKDDEITIYNVNGKDKVIRNDFYRKDSDGNWDGFSWVDEKFICNSCYKLIQEQQKNAKKINDELRRPLKKYCTLCGKLHEFDDDIKECILCGNKEFTVINTDKEKIPFCKLENGIQTAESAYRKPKKYIKPPIDDDYININNTDNGSNILLWISYIVIGGGTLWFSNYLEKNELNELIALIPLGLIFLGIIIWGIIESYKDI